MSIPFGGTVSTLPSTLHCVSSCPFRLVAPGPGKHWSSRARGPQGAAWAPVVAGQGGRCAGGAGAGVPAHVPQGPPRAHPGHGRRLWCTLTVVRPSVARDLGGLCASESLRTCISPPPLNPPSPLAVLHCPLLAQSLHLSQNGCWRRVVRCLPRNMPGCVLKMRCTLLANKSLGK